jgi:hypothetical protein
MNANSLIGVSRHVDSDHETSSHEGNSTYHHLICILWDGVLRQMGHLWVPKVLNRAFKIRFLIL